MIVCDYYEHRSLYGGVIKLFIIGFNMFQPFLRRFIGFHKHRKRPGRNLQVLGSVDVPWRFCTDVNTWRRSPRVGWLGLFVPNSMVKIGGNHLWVCVFFRFRLRFWGSTQFVVAWGLNLDWTKQNEGIWRNWTRKGTDFRCLHKWIWVWLNTYRYIFSGLFTSINPSYFGVHGTVPGFWLIPIYLNDLHYSSAAFWIRPARENRNMFWTSQPGRPSRLLVFSENV